MKNFKFNQLFQVVIAVAMIAIFSRCEELALDYCEDVHGDSTQLVEDSVILDTDTTAQDTIDTSGEDPDEPEETTTVLTACEECDYVVNSHLTDGNDLGIKPGDVVCLAADMEYKSLKFVNIVGTPDNPVIIRNCGGQASVYSTGSYGMKFHDSKDFKLTGNGSADEYGIKVTTEKGFFITMEHFTTDFEIARIEVAGAERYGIGERNGFAAIGIKTSPYQDCELFSDPTRTAWIMRNISVHDNYLHDVGGEGIYMGHGMYAGRQESACSQVTYSHSIKGVRIYNNLIEDVGFDGMQIKNADEDVKVYNNIVRNYGTREHGAHNEGLFIGEGTVGRFYNNFIDTGTGTGCQIQGMGDLYIYNNIFANQGGYGIYAAHGSQVIRKPDAPFNIFNNTIYNSGRMAYVFYNGDGGPKRFINNLVVKAPEFTKNDATTEKENNVFTNDENSVNFGNAGLQNYRLGKGSIGIDTGVDLSAYGVQDDCEGVARPRGVSFDAGAYEY